MAIYRNTLVYTMLNKPHNEGIKAMMKKTALLASALTLALVGANVHAQGPYAGVSAGISDYDLSGDLDLETATSFRATGGYKISENFALEASYIDFGDAEVKDFSTVEVNVTGLTFHAVGIAPINDRFSLFAKGGVMNWDAEITAPGIKEDTDGFDITAGVGAEFAVASNFSLIGELEHYKIDSESINSASIGIRARF
jgi:OOP family OmpA-OmpF porin